jgi:hypothetical protein
LRWVSQLMHSGEHEWDEQRLRSCIYPHDVEDVLRIRPMRHGRDDMVAWAYEKSGIFTVKSDYRLAMNEKE